jgi:hypothetical protein
MIAVLPRWGSLRQRARLIREQSGTTPGRLRAQSLAIGVAGVALFAVGAGIMAEAGSTVAAIANGTVPAILGAERLHATLADADRAVANAFLTGAVEASGPQQEFQLDLASAHRQLALAADRSAGQPAELARIQAVSTELAQYTQLVATAQDYNRLGYPVGSAYLRRASGLMHQPGTGILAQVDALAQLETATLSGQDTALAITGMVLLVYAALVIALLVMLVRTQSFVRQHFKRRRNPRLLAATALLLVLTAGSAVEVLYATESLFIAQGQAYSRLLGLWEMRSTMYDAYGNESLNLVARGDGNAFIAAFNSETRQLASATMTDTLVAEAAHGDVSFNGLLAAELEDASYPTERTAALEMLVAFRQFMGVNGAVQTSLLHGDHTSAALLVLGDQPGDLGAAFDRFDAAAGQAISSVQGHFAQTLALVEYSLFACAVLQVLALGVALLAYLGLKPRIDEYRT